jgi:hypothetical protein
MNSQAIPSQVIVATLVVDWLSTILNVLVLVGMLRSFWNQQAHTMLYCTLLQTFTTISFCVFAVLGKTELLLVNGMTPFYYDRADIMKTNSAWIQSICSTLLLLSMLPIYVGGLLQIWCVDAILSVQDTAFKKIMSYRPIWLFIMGYIPGVVTVAVFLLEMALRKPERFFSVNGAVIAPLNTSFVVISIYGISLIITFMACYYSLRCYRHIRQNESSSLQQVKRSGVPGYVVYQVIQMGFSFPIVGFTKTPELLIWLFPSAANIVFGYIGLISLMAFPFFTFLSNGSNKKVYPYVPFISGFLERVHESMATGTFWSPRTSDLESK